MGNRQAREAADRNAVEAVSAKEPLSREDAATLVDSIKRIEAGMKAVNASGLKRHAIVVLLADSTRVSKRNINKVLDGLGQLAATYIEVREGRQKL